MSFSGSVSSPSNSFKALERQAKNLENVVELKLGTLCKLGLKSNLRSKGDSAKEPLLGTISFESTADELEHLIDKLGGVVEELNVIAQASGSDPGNLVNMVNHGKVNRINELHKGYFKELKKMKDTYAAEEAREKLLSVSDFSLKSSKGLNQRIDFNLKEYQHINSSNRMVDDQISIAMEVKDHLGHQRVVFKKMQTRMNDLLNKVPLINGLIQRIHLRKRINALILGLVVGACTFLLLAYTFL